MKVPRSKISAFNTGRLYGPKGQRIAYFIHHTELTFIDYDRDIAGTVDLGGFLCTDGMAGEFGDEGSYRPSKRDVQWALLRAYDRYEYTPLSCGATADRYPGLEFAAREVTDESS